MAASLVALLTAELAFGDQFGRGAACDFITYGESSQFRGKFSSGTSLARIETTASARLSTGKYMDLV